MGRGRKTGGPELVDGAHGSEEAKRRLKVILEVLAGKRSVIEAGALLGLGEAMLHRLKTRAIQAGVESLEPKPTGRPRAEPARNAELEALQSEVRRLERELTAGQVREEIALAMPHLRKTGEGKKKRK